MDMCLPTTDILKIEASEISYCFQFYCGTLFLTKSFALLLEKLPTSTGATNSEQN